MERKLRMKEVKECYNNIISVGYCGAWYLLKCINREGWTCGVYGWNADVYEIDNSTAIVTGYRPFGDIYNHELTKEYNEKARKVWENKKMKYETKNKKVKKLLDEYINKILKMEE